MKHFKNNIRRGLCILLAACFLASFHAPMKAEAVGVSDAALYLWEILMASQGYYLTSKEDYENSFNAYGTYYNSLGAAEQADLVSPGEFASAPGANTIDNILDMTSDAMAKWYLSARAFFHDSYYKAANKLSGKESSAFTNESQIVSLFSNLPLIENSMNPSYYKVGQVVFDCMNKYGFLINRLGDSKYLDSYAVYVPCVDVSDNGLYFVQALSNFTYYIYQKSNRYPEHSSFYKLVYVRPFSADYFILNTGPAPKCDENIPYSASIFNSIPSHVSVYSESGSGSYVSVSAVAAASNAANALMVGSGDKGFELPDNITIGNTAAIPKTAHNVVTELGTEDSETTTLAVEEAILDLIGDLSEEIGDVADATEEASGINASWLSKIYAAVTSVLGFVSEAASKTYTVGGISDLLSLVSSILVGVTDSVGLLEDIPDSIAGSIASAFPGVFDIGDITKSFLEALPLPIILSIEALGDVLGDIKDTVVALPGIGAGTIDIPDTWSGPLAGILDGVTAIPNIFDIALEAKDVLTGVLDQVVALPRALVGELDIAISIDQPVVDEAAGELAATINSKLPDLSGIRDTIDAVRYPDSYNYPKIKIQTPAILKSFYPDDYIILFDGADYAKYFVWVRNIIRVMLWVGFGYSLFNHFKVRFHIG